MDEKTLLKLQKLQNEEKASTSNEQKSQVEKKKVNTSNESNYQFAPFSPRNLRIWREAHPNPLRDGSVYSCFRF